MSAETGTRAVSSLLYTGHILENAYRFVQDQKEEEDSLELTLKKWMCAIENGTCSA